MAVISLLTFPQQLAFSFVVFGWSGFPQKTVDLMSRAFVIARMAATDKASHNNSLSRQLLASGSVNGAAIQRLRQ
jgi:hypothetical protein